MTHHDALWETIKYIAKENGITRSGLARKCGLDATTFNYSKCQSPDGKPRWISTHTLYKVLVCTNTTPKKFATIFESFLDCDEK